MLLIFESAEEAGTAVYKLQDSTSQLMDKIYGAAPFDSSPFTFRFDKAEKYG
ncbi:MAG TPA: hypothetical protein VFL51_06435 [Pseudolabrys sp.]|nr:hypothetical protein [Pseudolabrys sp.]